MIFFEDVEPGESHTSGELVVTEAEIIDFARTWDPQPFHVDPEVAAKSPLGGITASSAHVFCIAARLMHELPPMAVIAGVKHEIELLAPTRPGERLALTVTCEEKRASRTKPDRGTLIMRSMLTASGAEVVARLNSTIMIARRPECVR